MKYKTYSPSMKDAIKTRLAQSGFLQYEGAYVLVDGQYGSTGKGLASGLLAELFGDAVDWVTSNAGPNSGHTSFHGDEKIVLKQLPTYPVVAWKNKHIVRTYLNAGALIDIETLVQECETHRIDAHVHPHAALIDQKQINEDGEKVSRIGSTGKGTGPALANKINRKPDAVVGDVDQYQWLYPMNEFSFPFNRGVGLVEVSQGFSLGLNSGFYPYTTSRECTVTQALSDARIHPSLYKQSMMVVRAFPIRVAGNSGPCYPDQSEISWETLKVEPELTTVTQKVRRVFTWSDMQFADALLANRPEHVFVNFVNYVEHVGANVDQFVRDHVYKIYIKTLGVEPKSILLGWGPKSDNVGLWNA